MCTKDVELCKKESDVC